MHTPGGWDRAAVRLFVCCLPLCHPSLAALATHLWYAHAHRIFTYNRHINAYHNKRAPCRIHYTTGFRCLLACGCAVTLFFVLTIHQHLPPANHPPTITPQPTRRPPACSNLSSICERQDGCRCGRHAGYTGRGGGSQGGDVEGRRLGENERASYQLPRHRDGLQGGVSNLRRTQGPACDGD